MYELRYLIRNGWDGPEKVLQYRTQQERTHYDANAFDGGGRLVSKEWTEWKYIPEVKDE